jgi:hypothetical protein
MSSFGIKETPAKWWLGWARLIGSAPLDARTLRAQSR